MNKIKAAIIEDEIPAARLLRDTLLSLRPDWEVQLLPGNIEGGSRCVRAASSSGYPVSGYSANGWQFFSFYRTGASGEYDCIYYCL